MFAGNNFMFLTMLIYSKQFYLKIAMHFILYYVWYETLSNEIVLINFYTFSLYLQARYILS